jgi:outer membrane protein OmpA-like peptidoglycan-associated protein
VIGPRSLSQRRGEDEAEKPFWISYADLMTALMVLFLVVMAVALVAITGRDGEHKKKIDKCMAIAVEAAKRHDGVNVDLDRNVIDFGDRARFGFNSSVLTPEQESVLRRFVPELLSMADSEVCKWVLKRIVVEGYTDKTGNYLTNLNLSLMRSQRVLCAMFKTDGPSPLTDAQKEAVRDVFLVGGFAFNASKDTPEESRRVEMRIEFLGIDEKRVALPQGAAGGFGACAIC